MKKFFQGLLRHIKETFFHVGWFLFFIIPFFVIMNVAYVIIQNTQREAIVTELESNAMSQINSVDLYINTRMEALHNDLYIIRDANDTQHYLADQSASNLTEFELFLYRISMNQGNFISIKIADTAGNLLYKISRDGDTLATFTDNLGDVSNEDYYERMLDLDTDKIYIAKLKLIDTDSVLTFILPLIHNDIVINYLIVDYNAESFLDVFSMYAQSELEYLTLGLINSGSVWLSENSLNELHPTQNDVLAQQILTDIENEHQIVSSEFDIRTHEDDYVIDSDNYIQIFMMYDLNAAIDQSGYYILNHQWVNVVINVFVFLFVSIVSFMLRIQNETKLQVNANSYLSAQNENAIVITDGKLRFTYINDAFTNIYGYALQDIYLKHVPSVLQTPELTEHLAISSGEDFSGNNWDIAKSGVYILKYLQVKQQLAFGRRDKHYIGIFSEPKIAINDYLKYIENPDKEIHNIKFLLNLFEFKVNESTLIMIATNHANTYDFANFLKNKLSSKFVVMIPKLNHVMLYVNVNPDEYHQMIEQIDNLIDFYRFLPTTLNDFTHIISVAQSSDELNDIPSLIDGLVIAMSCMDAHTQSRHHFYHPDMKANIKRRYQIYQALEEGFQNNEFYLNYQIQKNLTTGEYDGAEALLRWHNEKLGQIYPDEFIPIIERSFYINHLSSMVLTTVIRDIEPYLSVLPDQFRISINLSNFDFSNDYVMNQLLKIIENSKIPPSRFVFEIIESIYIDNIERTNKIIDMLHAYDIKVAIDDFGAGYSSISSLKSIAVDYVKTDKQFMMGYPDKDDGVTLERMINIVHDMKKPILVEGTETQEQIDFCKAHHVSRVQGYVISKPKPIDDMMHEFFHIPNKKD